MEIMEIKTIPWKSEYSVGLNTVDKQHKRFLDIINELGSHINDDSCKTNASKVFFTLIHFNDVYLIKEKMLATSVENLDYSYFREKHKQFVAKLQIFQNEYDESKSKQLFVNLYNYLKEYYPKYISCYTPSLINILKQNGIE